MVGGGEGTIWPLNEHKNFHFDNEQDIHMSFENYKLNSHELDLILLFVSH